MSLRYRSGLAERGWRGRARAFAMLALVALAACDSSTCRSLPYEFLGRWHETGSSGGLAGTGSGEGATGHTVIGSDNTMQLFDHDGVLIETLEFEVSRGRTIFSDVDQWMVRCDGGEPEVIRLADGGRVMSLSENVYDGVSRHYARAPADAADLGDEGDDEPASRDH